MNIEELRKYRIQAALPFFNNQSQGIALFDLVGTFLIAYLIKINFLTNGLVQIRNDIYFIYVIYLGLLIHVLINQNTFLNTQIFNNELNIYKILLFASAIYIHFN